MNLTQPWATVIAGCLAVTVAIIALTGVLLTRQQNEKHFAQTYELAGIRALRERYTTCAEQLAHEKPTVRLAGVYALAALADDWSVLPAKDSGQNERNAHETGVCIDLLCSYLRAPMSDDNREREVRAAITEVIRRHAADWWGYKLNLAGADFTNADLHGAWLTGADLAAADLTDANLRGANLIAAELIESRLRGACLAAAQLKGANLTDANLAEADLHGADLSGANLHGADLVGANLRGVKLRGANFFYTDLTRAKSSHCM